MVLLACEPSLGLRLLTPEDGAVISCTSADAGVVRFSWSRVASAQSYTLVVYDASGAQFRTRTTTETTVELELPCGASYSWQVAANPGGTSYWSGKRRFTLGAEGFSLITPRNGEVIQCTTPNKIQFTWTAVRDVSAYNLTVRNSRRELVVSERVAPGQTSVEFTLACGDTYTWQVVAIKNFPNPPVESPVWTFTITAPREEAPAPQLLSPPDGAAIGCQGAEADVRFAWTTVANANSYTLEVYRASDGALVQSRVRIAEPWAILTLPCRPETYRWRVASHVNSTAQWSTFSTFSISPSAVGAPQLLSPRDGATIECLAPDNGQVNFDWTDVPNATNYTLEVYKAADGALFLSRTVTASQSTETVVCRPELALSYRWRVAANVGGQSVWSGFSTFTMTVEKPFLVSPANGSSVAVGPGACAGTAQKSVQFTWTVVLNASSYRLDVFNAGGVLVGSTVVTGATNTTATVSWTESGCPASYTWRVTAIKTAPNPPVTSDTWSFTTVP